MTTLLRGESASISVKFRTGVVFAESPDWSLYDPNDEVINLGAAIQDGTKWKADISIPLDLPIPDNSVTLLLEFVGYDGNGKEHFVGKEITVIDLKSDEDTYGILWYPKNNSITESMLLPKRPTSIDITLQEGDTLSSADPVVLATTTIDSPTEILASERGFLYSVTLDGISLKRIGSGNHPLQLVVQANYASGNPDVIIKPVYGISPLISSKINQLRRYLDKGQFTDIDPNLQWSDEELIHWLMEGMQYVNAAEPEVTYWTLESSIRPLDSPIFMAAAWCALNARYLAEGFSKFNFSSGAVNLDWDRTGIIETKMNELKNTLDNMLPKAKRAAIAVAGTGGPTRNIGTIGISLGPMTNYPLRGSGIYRRG